MGPRSGSGLALIAALACGQPVLAEPADGLPPPTDYRGEIRRGPDGKLMVVPPAPAAGRADEAAAPATMRVGPGEKVATLAEAARLARDGEVIEIAAGIYRGPPVVWTQDRLLIRGAGGERPVMLADGRNGGGRALWIVRGGKLRIENIEFRGARAANGQGAALRFEAGQLSVAACRFIDNEVGLATADGPALSLEVVDSEFGEAPQQGSVPHHLLDVGAIGRLSLRGSRLHDGYLGHLLRSRARDNRLFYNLLADGAGGKAYYELAFPDGGLAYVVGNVIAQGAGSSHPAMIAYGGEGAPWPENGLYLAHNTLLNERHAGDFLLIRGEPFAAGVEIWAINNLLVGAGQLFPPARGRFEGNRTASRNDLIEYGGLPLRLTNLSPLRGGLRPPGSVSGVDLMPQAEFGYPQGSRPIRATSSLAPGAFQ